MNILIRLQSIDRRIIYIAVAVVIAVSLLILKQHPTVIFREVQRSYDAINSVPKGKIALISAVWSAGTQAANGPQTEAIMRHLFRNGTKFAIISWDPAGTQLTYDLADRVAKEEHKSYGKDWVHLGFNPGPIFSVISGMGKDFQAQFKTDINGKPLSQFPAIANVKDHNQIGIVAEITPSGTLEFWIAYFNQPYKVPLIYCPTAVMSVEAYKYLDSDQLVGMLNDVIGAAQYETLLGQGQEQTYAGRACWALSCAHILVIILIIVGNLGYWASRRRAAAEGEETGVG